MSDSLTKMWRQNIQDRYKTDTRPENKIQNKNQSKRQKEKREK